MHWNLIFFMYSDNIITMHHSNQSYLRKKLQTEIPPFFFVQNFRVVSNSKKILTRLVHAGFFVVSIVHRTLTWTTGSLTCVCDLFACVCTLGTSVSGLIRRTYVVCIECDSREILGRAQNLVTHLFGDHAQSPLCHAKMSQLTCTC